MFCSLICLSNVIPFAERNYLLEASKLVNYVWKGRSFKGNENLLVSRRILLKQTESYLIIK